MCTDRVGGDSELETGRTAVVELAVADLDLLEFLGFLGSDQVVFLVL